MTLLIQFLLRLTFGLAAGMAITSPKLVTSGYFRNHLYVTLGLTALAALLARSAAPDVFWYAVGAAVASYVGSVCWLYEKPYAGKLSLLIVWLAALGGALETSKALYGPETDRTIVERYMPVTSEGITPEEAGQLEIRRRLVTYACPSLQIAVNITSGLLLGLTMAAMLLGHWYLNSPTMELAPLRRLILAMSIAIALQAAVSSLGLWGELASVSNVTTQWALFVVLRWLFGLVGVAALAWMAWQTLKIPNTQSATGILYVAVIGTFVGETMALLLSRESLFPL